MTPTEARAAMARMGLSQVALARRLADWGDARPYTARLRAVQETVSPSRTIDVPWAFAALLRVLEQWQQTQQTQPSPPALNAP